MAARNNLSFSGNIGKTDDFTKTGSITRNLEFSSQFLVFISFFMKNDMFSERDACVLVYQDNTFANFVENNIYGFDK